MLNTIRATLLLALPGLFAAFPVHADDVKIGLSDSTFSAQYEDSVVQGWRAQSKGRTDVLNIAGGAAQVAAEAGLDVVMLSGAEESALCLSGELANASATLELELDHLTSQPKCGVPFVSYGKTIAYNPSNIARPVKVSDFFEPDEMPGFRALPEHPKGVLEFALIADGTPPEDVYAALETSEGLEQALAKLDQIKPFVFWSPTSSASLGLLRDGEVTLALTWATPFNQAVQNGADFKNTSDFMLVEHSYLAVPMDATKRPGAKSFLEYATSPAGMVAFVNAFDGRFSVPSDAANAAFPGDGDKALACPRNECPCAGISGSCEKDCCKDLDGIAGHFEINEDFWTTHNDRLRTKFESWKDQ